VAYIIKKDYKFNMNKVLLTIFGAAAAMKTKTESLESKLSLAETTQETLKTVQTDILAQVANELDLSTASDEELANHCGNEIHCHHDEYLDVLTCECKCLALECPQDFSWD
jgi:trans-2-enoyl-CoA reductase